MKTIKKNLKWITIVIVVIIVIIAFYIKCTLLTNNNKESSPEENEILIEEVTETKEETVQPTLVYVDIKGAIQNPGVYEIEENKKVIDQTTPNMIQRISEIFERKPLISKEI